MTTETLNDHLQTPPDDRFEERLLATILDDFSTLAAAPAPSRAPRRRRLGRQLSGRWAMPVLATAAAAAVAVAVISAAGLDGGPAQTRTGPAPTGGGSRQVVTGGSAPVLSAKASALYKLADASAGMPAQQGRYVVLSETDAGSGQSGPTQRTSVIDSQTGASVTYQQPPAGSAIPKALIEGPDATNTEAWFQALPTDPTALRAKLLSIAQTQMVPVQKAFSERLQELEQQDPAAAGKLATVRAQARISDDDQIYEEANDLLWSPLVQPALRSALYKVLAATSGFTLNPQATDPDGRPAVAMTYSTSVGGTPETDITYEDPATGAVLAQVWKNDSGTITAVYQPVTSSNTQPSDPYDG